MKKFALTFLLLSSVITCFSQDIIETSKGDEIKAYVQTLTPKSIIYSIDSLGVDKKEILTSDVLSIKYRNGVTAILRPKIGTNSSDTCIVAMNDAEKLYPSPAAYTFVPTILFAPVGLVIAIARSSELKERGIIPSHSTFLESQHYKDCYIQVASEKRVQKAWSGFGYGMLTNLIVAVALGMQE